MKTLVSLAALVGIAVSSACSSRESRCPTDLESVLGFQDPSGKTAETDVSNSVLTARIASAAVECIAMPSQAEDPPTYQLSGTAVLSYELAPPDYPPESSRRSLARFYAERRYREASTASVQFEAVTSTGVILKSVSVSQVLRSDQSTATISGRIDGLTRGEIGRVALVRARLTGLN